MHSASTSTTRSSSAVGGGERRHDHHDVTERAEEDAPTDRPGADPSAPALAAFGRSELDAGHETTPADLGDPVEPLTDPSSLARQVLGHR